MVIRIFSRTLEGSKFLKKDRTAVFLRKNSCFQGPRNYCEFLKDNKDIIINLQRHFVDDPQGYDHWIFQGSSIM